MEKLATNPSQSLVCLLNPLLQYWRIPQKSRDGIKHREVEGGLWWNGNVFMVENDVIWELSFIGKQNNMDEKRICLIGFMP